MKKLLIAMVLGALLVLALATVAQADFGPHGNFGADEDACAGCHRVHTAQSADGFLLKSADIYQLCTSCHDGSGAYTDVLTGTYTDATNAYGYNGQGLFAGGFESVPMNPVRSLTNGYTVANYPSPATVTSKHVVDGGSGTVWGAGDLDEANGTYTLTLECTSCHNPHGNAGHVGGVHTGAAAPTYRILRFEPEGSDGFGVSGVSTSYFYVAGQTELGTLGGAYVADVSTKWYTINSSATYDGTLMAYRSRWDGTSTQFPWWSFTNGPGDYSGRSYVYLKPAVNVATPGNTAQNGGVLGAGYTWWSCSQGTTGGAVDATCDTDGVAAGAHWSNTTPAQKLGQWCGTCHDRYVSTSAARTTNSGDSLYTYRHNATGSLTCVYCHVAHGTAATMNTALAQNATQNTGSSTLLKLNNRGLCVDCHGYDFGIASTPMVTP